MTKKIRVLSRLIIIITISIITILISISIVVGKTYATSNEHQNNKIETITETSTIVTEPIESIKPALPLYNIPLSKELQEYTFNMCLEQNISYELILAVMWHESKMNIHATHRNSNGSIDKGIMQINSFYIKEWVKEYQIKDFYVFNPYKNIELGIKNIKDLETTYISKDYFDDDLIYAVLGAYNYGESGYRSYIKRHKHQPSYVFKVLEYKEDLETIQTFSDYIFTSK